MAIQIVYIWSQWVEISDSFESRQPFPMDIVMGDMNKSNKLINRTKIFSFCWKVKNCPLSGRYSKFMSPLSPSCDFETDGLWERIIWWNYELNTGEAGHHDCDPLTLCNFQMLAPSDPYSDMHNSVDLRHAFSMKVGIKKWHSEHNMDRWNFQDWTLCDVYSKIYASLICEFCLFDLVFLTHLRKKQFRLQALRFGRLVFV